MVTPIKKTFGRDELPFSLPHFIWFVLIPLATGIVFRLVISVSRFSSGGLVGRYLEVSNDLNIEFLSKTSQK